MNTRYIWLVGFAFFVGAIIAGVLWYGVANSSSNEIEASLGFHQEGEGISFDLEDEIKLANDTTLNARQLIFTGEYVIDVFDVNGKYAGTITSSWYQYAFLDGMYEVHINDGYLEEGKIYIFPLYEG